MSNYIQHRYNSVQIPVTSTLIVPDISGIGGFLAVTGGTIAIETYEPTPRVIIPALTVVAGTWYEMPFALGEVNGAIVITAGGASGVLAVS